MKQIGSKEWKRLGKKKEERGVYKLKKKPKKIEKNNKENKRKYKE